VGISGLIIGVDASIEMLRAARQALRYPVVAGALPSLPFRDETFDVAAAGFVISHVADYKRALGNSKLSSNLTRIHRREKRLKINPQMRYPPPRVDSPFLSEERPSGFLTYTQSSGCTHFEQNSHYEPVKRTIVRLMICEVRMRYTDGHSSQTRQC